MRPKDCSWDSDTFDQIMLQTLPLVMLTGMDDGLDTPLQELLKIVAARKDREARGRMQPHVGAHPVEGRRGRERRAVLEQYAPEDLPRSIPRGANSREQIRLSNAANREQVNRLVTAAATTADVYPDAEGRVLGAFFEAMAAELVTGRCVVIPGVGAFCARPSRPHPGRRQRCYLAFTAARNLGVRISEWAAFNANECRRWENFRINHRPAGRSWRAIALSPEMRVRRAWSRIGQHRVQRKASPAKDSFMFHGTPASPHPHERVIP